MGNLSCRPPLPSPPSSGEDDLKKGTQLLEVYALEIQMYTATKNNKKLASLYTTALEMHSRLRASDGL